MRRVICIMSIYNESLDVINKALDSILNQRILTPDVLVVVDNPSRREELGFLDSISIPRVKVIFNEVNMGLARSLNSTLPFTKGYSYVMRMDSDDISHSFRLYNQIKYLIKNQLDLVGCNANFIDEDGEVISYDNCPNTKLTAGTIAFHPTWLMKTEVFLVLKGYNNYNTSQDYDFLCRAQLLGFKIGNLKKTLFSYRIRASSLSSTARPQQVSNKLFIMKHYKKGSLNNISPPEYHRSLSSSIYEVVESLRGKSNFYKLFCLLSPWHLRLKFAQIT